MCEIINAFKDGYRGAGRTFDQSESNIPRVEDNTVTALDVVAYTAGGAIRIFDHILFRLPTHMETKVDAEGRPIN